MQAPTREPSSSLATPAVAPLLAARALTRLLFLAAAASAAACSLEEEAPGDDAGLDPAAADASDAERARGPGAASACTRASTPTLLTSSSTAKTYRYTETVRAVTYGTIRTESTAYSNFIAFLDEVNQTADVDVYDQRALLERQRDVFIRYLGPDAGLFHQRILDGEVGTLGDITCIQSILFDLQNRDWPLSLGPVEMGAYILERRVGSNTQLRAYVKTQKQSDVTGISLSDLDARLNADLAAGWQLRAHMHNHPLSPDGIYDIAGTVIPSTPDSNTYRALRDQKGLREAWITNGVDSALYLASEFDELE
jgi:hypothetical protein